MALPTTFVPLVTPVDSAGPPDPPVHAAKALQIGSSAKRMNVLSRIGKLSFQITRNVDRVGMAKVSLSSLLTT